VTNFEIRNNFNRS